MPDAVIIEVANAIVASIGDIDFGETVIARRRWGDVNDSLSDTELRQVIIDVVPWNFDPDLDTTHKLDYSQSFDIFLRRSLSENEQEPGQGLLDLAEVDRLVKFLQYIWEHFVPTGPTSGRLTTESGYTAEYEPKFSRMMMLWNRKNLKLLRQYNGWLRLGYQVSKDVE